MISVDAAEVQLRWKSVAKRFPLWRFMFDLFFDMSSWRMIGADITTLMLESKNVRSAAQALESASEDTLEALARVARVNEQRSNDIFRAVFLGYVSVPLAMGAMLSDAAPEALSGFISEYSAVLVMVLIGAVLFPIVYFCGNWRAKQIAWTIDLYRAGAVAPLPERKRGAAEARA